MPDPNAAPPTPTDPAPKDPNAEVKAILQEKPATSAKVRSYTHTICDTTMEMPEEDYNDMKANPSRWLSLPCSKCGHAYRLGEDGEMVWAGSKEKVDPENVPS